MPRRAREVVSAFPTGAGHTSKSTIHLMKIALLLSVSVLVVTPAVSAADGQPVAPAKPAASQRHALKGVVTAVLAEKSALMVKHEEIPGVMRAMTMMFKVDGPTLKAVQPGDSITGLMSRKDDAWVLEAVKITAQKQAK